VETLLIRIEKIFVALNNKHFYTRKGIIGGNIKASAVKGFIMALIK